MSKHTVCEENDLPVGSLKPFKAGDTKVVVYHLDDGF